MKIAKNTVLILVLGLLALSACFMGGCAKKLEGTVYDNEKPIVWFVNVPPEDSRSSVNPIINWYGQDRDGQIDFYRYIVVREDIMGDSLGKPVDWNPTTEPLSPAEIQAFVDNYLVGMSDTLWTVLLVRADSTDPHTSNIVPMSAQMDDPVRTFVPQFVFVQAFDEEGLGSDIVFRRFLRNDNPPATRIVAFIEGVPFINSVLPTGPATGIRLRWQGSDVLDYPTDPPPFEFEWKLFGPYTQTDYDEIIDSFLVPVFVSNDARIFKFGQPPDTVGYDTFWNADATAIDSIRPVLLGTALIVCDTTYENGVEVESCDTILIDTLEGSNIYGTMDTLLRVYDDDFINSSYYVVADSSHDQYGNVWTTELRDSIYNVYWNHPADTTQAGLFIFVVRSRDDARVPDLTPAWRSFTVFNPQHERDILVVNWSNSADENRYLPKYLPRYWNDAVNNWITQTGHNEVVFDTLLDVKHVSGYQQYNRMLNLILKYKVAIMIQDAEVSGVWTGQGQPYENTLVGLQTGVNVWVAMRVPLGVHLTGASFAEDDATGQYQFFFGVQQYTFPGWSAGFFNLEGGWGFGLPRTEHFIGTLSLDEEQWPELAVDTNLLRDRYHWEGTIDPPVFPFVPYLPELGALPQVGWCVRTFDTEAMYLFKSKYGSEHAIFRRLSFHGRPVGIRLNRGLFRTVHFLFTPMALEQAGAQEITNNVLNWLYDGRVELSSAGKFAKNDAAASELADRYWRCYWEADGDADRFYELYKNAF